MDARASSPAWVGGALLAALLTGCSSDDAQSEAGAASPSAPASASSVAAPTGAPPTPGAVVLADEMDDDRNGWGTFPGVTFTRGEYVAALTPPEGLAGWPDALMGSTPPSVVVTSTLSAPQGSAIVGVTCNNVMNGQGGGDFYSLSVGNDVMVISRTSNTDRTPAAGQVLATTDTGVDLAAQHELQAACIRSGQTMELWLAVDGRPVLSAVDDDPLAEGPPGLQLVGLGSEPFEARVTSWSVTEPA